MCRGIMVHFRPPLQGAGEKPCSFVIEITFTFNNAYDMNMNMNMVAYCCSGL